jgi:hypothetical protein
MSRAGILERQFWSRFLGINLNLLRLVFLSGFLLSFSVPHNAIHEQTRVFLFADFFVRVFVTREVYEFLLNPP